MTKKKLTFEESLARLEEILDALENGDAKLDETLKLYEEGVTLVRACNQYLQTAEQTVKQLRVNADGTAELADFGE